MCNLTRLIIISDNYQIIGDCSETPAQTRFAPESITAIGAIMIGLTNPQSTDKQATSRSFSQRLSKRSIILLIIILATISCGLPEAINRASESSAVPESISTPSTPLPLTNTSDPPTDTPVPTPPSETPTLEPLPASPTPTISPWILSSGMWSGCLEGNPPSSNTILQQCSNPTGNFITFYLTPTCLIGNVCGTYVKGRFESEAIILKLEFQGIQGSIIYMYANAGSGMFSWASTNIELELVGANLVIREAASEGYTLLKGCDPIIAQNVTWGCKQ